MTKINPYKAITGVSGALLLFMVLYLAYRGISPVLDDIAESRFDNMTLEKSKCLARYEKLTEGLVLE